MTTEELRNLRLRAACALTDLEELHNAVIYHGSSGGMQDSAGKAVVYTRELLRWTMDIIPNGKPIRP